MPGYTVSYNNDRFFRFYSSAKLSGKEGYNPIITIYYGSDDNIVRVEEEWRGELWGQTISGSSYAQNWPDYSYYEVVSSWDYTTVS